MSRPRIQPRDEGFWDAIRLLLDEAKGSGPQNWSDIADTLGLSKQALTAFRKRRKPALDAEAVLRLCTRFHRSLAFEGQTICSNDPEVNLSVEFDDSFQIAAHRSSPGVAVTTRKPPGRVSFIGVRIERVSGSGTYG